jgi:hypothetical protein
LAVKLLITGNCHAQYLGAALRTVPGLKVAVLGKAYIGPIHFNRSLPRLVGHQAAKRWLREGDLVLQQVTGGRAHWAEFSAPAGVSVVPYPYFEVRSRFGLDERIDMDRAFAQAELDPEPVRQALQRPASVYHYSKFAGDVFATLLEGLAPRLPFESSDVMAALRADRGIAHDPEPSLLAEPASSELVDHVRWRDSLTAYRSTGRSFANCIDIYRPRLFTAWALEMTGALMKRGRTHLATKLLCSRIAFEDARGRLLAHGLGMAWQIRHNYDAYRALERAAQARPRTGLPFLFAAVRRLS